MRYRAPLLQRRPVRSLRTLLLPLSVLLATSSSVAAQAYTPLGARGAEQPQANATLLLVSTARDVPTDPWEVPLRIGAGLVGSAGGFIGGAVIGAGTAGGCHGDYCGVGPALLGGAIGSVLVASLASSLPEIGNKCSAESRLARGVVGGIAGALTSGVLGLVGGPLCVITYLGGAGIGAGWAAATCGGG